MQQSSWVLVFLSSAACAGAISQDPAYMPDPAPDPKNRPVSKVITILKDMVSTMEKEQEEDEDIYNKMACWCETNDREKTKSIAEAEAKIEALTTTIEELTQLSAQLATEIKNTEAEVAANQASLDKATAIRAKQLAEFNGEEKDMLESIAALKGALVVLSKHHSMLQGSDSAALKTVVATMEREMKKHANLLNGALTGSERRKVSAFIQAPSFASQSGEVYGILEQMLTTFESNLSETQKEEMANAKAYAELKAAKESEIAAGKAQIAMKTGEKADADQKNAHAKQDLEDTNNSLSADEKFLMMLKEKCSMTDREWEERQKTRQLEMETCAKALAVLSGDNAHDLFTKTFNPALIQSDAEMTSVRRSQAAKLISDAASKAHNPKLAALAVKIRLDAFTRVKKAIDEMIAMLLQEKEDEIKQKDFCVEEFHENEDQTDKKNAEKEDLIAKIADLSQTIKELTEAIDTLKAEVAELQLQLKRAGEDREKQNKEFQATIADQRDTQRVLANALKILQGFYGETAAAKAPAEVSLGQQEPAPDSFQKYEKSGASEGVMNLIQDIITDAKKMEAETIRAEEDSQKAYEDFVKGTNASIEAKNAEIVNKTEEKAFAEADLVQAQKDKDNVMLELEQLSNYNAQLHSSCDFVLKNFDLRQTARDEEVHALRTAKDILSGAKFQDFLQN